MDQLKMRTENLADKNFDVLSSIFPNAITESIVGYDERNNPIIERAIDVDVLRQEISCNLIEGKGERYGLSWPDKRKAILLSNAPTNMTLRPVRNASISFENPENVYIEGDNLEALKLLQETYLGKIKMIYIDPPYNTKSAFEHYDDNMEHSIWLSTIYPRLELLREFLTEDGSIWITVDM